MSSDPSMSRDQAARGPALEPGTARKPASPVRLELPPADGGGVAELVFDDPARPVNVLSIAAIDALDAAIDELGHVSSVRALLVRSAKESFIAGADLEEIARVSEGSIAVGHSARVHRLFGRLEGLPFPVVAAIHGPCLGGGLELALACHVRLASDHPTTRLGLPEVKLGIIPGFGGTQRLPRLVGARKALDLVLKGYSLGARDARRAGLVDEVLPAGSFLTLARQESVRLAEAGLRRRRPRLALADRLLAAIGPARDLFFLGAERAVRKSTRGHYPAPEKAIHAMREGLRSSLEEGLEVEAGLVGSLAVSPECKALVRVFFLSEAARKDPGVSLELSRSVASAGVIGAGVMGAGIAALLAEAGIAVRMRDVSLEALGRGLGSVSRTLAGSARRRRAGRGQEERWRRLVSPTVDATGFGRAGIVIEAVVEDLAMKRQVLEELEAVMSPEAVFATNTSALSVSELARFARRPERVVGMHFFNPVAKMPLVEVVRADSTSDVTLATTVQLARDLGKVPIVVGDGPGFLVNRLLAPYLQEALGFVAAGVDPAAVDRAMLDFGMPMGPLELLDEVGLDVAQHVAGTLAAAFPERMTASPLVAALVLERRLGKKSGRGFYRHERGRTRPDPGLARTLRKLGVRSAREAIGRGILQERMILAMVNEAARALEEGIVRSPGECDLAMVLGTGFPPFRGGLFAFAESLGVEAVFAALERLESELGERFRPAPLIQALHSKGRGFLNAREVMA